MKKLYKSITLAVVGIAFCLGVMVTTANAQFGRRGGFSINVSLGSGHRIYRPRYSSYRVYSPVIYRTRRPVYVYPRDPYYYDSGYYRPAPRYVVTRIYGRSHGSSWRYRRY